MATFTKIDDFVNALGLGKHNLDTDTLKVFLTNTAPTPSTDLNYGTGANEIDDLATGNGYTKGGSDISGVWSESGGTGTLSGTDVTWTASGGSIGPFQYVVLYNDTHTDDPLIGYWDYGSAVTLADGDTFTVDFGTSILTVA